MSDTADITDQIEQVVADHLRVEQDVLDDETAFDGETLDADSLDMVEIAEAVESDVGVHIPDTDLEELTTVGELTTYVSDRA